MPKTVDPKLTRKLKALKRMKAEAVFVPKNQSMQALDREIARLQGQLQTAPTIAPESDVALLHAQGRHTQYVLHKLDALRHAKQAAKPDLDAAKAGLQRAIVSQSLPDEG